MFNKKLLKLLSHNKKYVIGIVVVKWIQLLLNITFVFSISFLISKLFEQSSHSIEIYIYFVSAIVALTIKSLLFRHVTKLEFLAANNVKKTLRLKILNIVFDKGIQYEKFASTSELTQLSTEGIEQLETYYSKFIPQFFYSFIAPLTLFSLLSFVNFKIAVILLICVPLIPITIAMIQKIAKHFLSKYWGQYMNLGHSFLDNLGGLVFLKNNQSDDHIHQKMNNEAIKFRKVTMRVLTMQLNSITVMDLIAFGGAALGFIMALSLYNNGDIGVFETILVILISSEFFIPMRVLGSYFHVAMNGIAASKQLFKILEQPYLKKSYLEVDFKKGFVINKLSFSINDKMILKNISAQLELNKIIGITGVSGSGKSTFAKILSKTHETLPGSIFIDGKDFAYISKEQVLKSITYVSDSSYIFPGTIKEMLLEGDKNASDQKLKNILKTVQLQNFDLSYKINPNGSNLSGGQKNRLVIARALLHDTTIYVFDEIFSGVDIEAEQIILDAIEKLRENHLIIMISHRIRMLENVDHIFIFEKGSIVEKGSHEELLKMSGLYKKLYDEQYVYEKLLIKEGESYA